MIYAKKDFYFSFINSSGRQISQKSKQEIKDGFEVLENIKKMQKQGQIKEAYDEIKSFKKKNKIAVLDSDIMVLYSSLALKIPKKRVHIDATRELENAITASKINQYDLSLAYFLLVQLKLKTNKIEDAKYFARTIIDSFNDELTKTKGKISLAKIYKYQGNYVKAINVLNEILRVTKDKEVATVVADELFDIYILNKNFKEAKELISKVLRSNITYYVNNPYLANLKINKLIDAKMYEYATQILKELLNNSISDDAIEDFKFRLGNLYMLMYDHTNFYLEKAKEMYKDILNDYPQGIYAKNAKMYIDEILMRQNILKPSSIEIKYKNSEDMKNKALLQELLNKKTDKRFDFIIKNKKAYINIPIKIVQRFGYKSIKDIFDDIDIDLIKEYLDKKECTKLNVILKDLRQKAIDKIIQDDSLKYNFFNCLKEEPSKKRYFKFKRLYEKTKNNHLILVLEIMAYKLNFIEEALSYSQRLDSTKDMDILKEEFLYKYLILKAKNNIKNLNKFFKNINSDFIEENKDNPIIIDFYYDYYLYLSDKKETTKAEDILRKLYKKQKLFKAYIYSPFVEQELAKYNKNNPQKELSYLFEALKNTRRLKPNDEVKIYYEILNIYDKINKKNKKNEYLKKCQEVKNTKDSLYKKMCDEM